MHAERDRILASLSDSELVMYCKIGGSVSKSQRLRIRAARRKLLAEIRDEEVKIWKRKEVRCG